MRLRISCADGRKLSLELAATATWGDLQTALLLKLDESPGEIQAGFPPRPLHPAHPEQPVAQLGIRSGDTLHVLIASPEAPPLPAASVPQMVIRQMPDDNSCLFSAVAYVMHQDRSRAGELRQLAAHLVLSDPANYDAAVLGRDPAEYAQWIAQPHHWGGAIELALLARHYATEMASVEVASGRVDIFGQAEGYAQRAYLLYSGIHYDALALPRPPPPGRAANAQYPGRPTEQTLFSPTADEILLQALQLADLARQQHQYTDLAQFTLRCEQCGQALVGQAEAHAHASATGHARFAEYVQAADSR